MKNYRTGSAICRQNVCTGTIYLSCSSCCCCCCCCCYCCCYCWLLLSNVKSNSSTCPFTAAALAILITDRHCRTRTITLKPLLSATFALHQLHSNSCTPTFALQQFMSERTHVPRCAVVFFGVGEVFFWPLFLGHVRPFFTQPEKLSLGFEHQQTAQISWRMKDFASSGTTSRKIYKHNVKSSELLSQE